MSFGLTNTPRDIPNIKEWRLPRSIRYLRHCLFGRYSCLLEKQGAWATSTTGFTMFEGASAVCEAFETRVFCELHRVSWTYYRRRRIATKSTACPSSHGFPSAQDSQGTSVIPRTRQLLSEVYLEYLEYCITFNQWHTECVAKCKVLCWPYQGSRCEQVWNSLFALRTTWFPMKATRAIYTSPNHLTLSQPLPLRHMLRRYITRSSS